MGYFLTLALMTTIGAAVMGIFHLLPNKTRTKIKEYVINLDK